MIIFIRKGDQDKLNLDYIIIGLKSGNIIEGGITGKRGLMLHESFNELDGNLSNDHRISPSIDQFDLFKKIDDYCDETSYEVNRYYIDITQIEYIVFDESDHSLYLDIERGKEIYAVGIGDDGQDE